jgi:hypothetical protein
VDYLATVSDGDREAGREQIRELFCHYRLAMPMARLTAMRPRCPSLVTRPFASASVWASSKPIPDAEQDVPVV